MSRFPHDKKFQFLLDKMDQYLSFFFFYEKPLWSTKPFHDFLTNQLMSKVLDIKHCAKEQDNEWIGNNIKSVLCTIMHFCSILQRLSIGLSNWSTELLSERRKFFEINYDANHVKNKQKRISDSDFFSEYARTFVGGELFTKQIDWIQNFSEDQLSTMMRGQKVLQIVIDILFY